MSIPHEIQVETGYVYQGRIINIRVDRAEFPDGKQVTREVCEHCGGVAVLPLDDDGNVVLVRQYRYPYGEELLEIPAGKLEWGTGEEPLLGAARELREETGLTAASLEPLGCIYPSPGFLTEVLHLYLARGLTQSEASPDEDEYLNVVRMPLEELTRKIMADEVRDAKTIAAVLKTMEMLRS